MVGFNGEICSWGALYACLLQNLSFNQTRHWPIHLLCNRLYCKRASVVLILIKYTLSGTTKLCNLYASFTWKHG